MTHTNIIINELNRMFTDFNAIFFDNKLPDVEIVIQRKGKHSAFGWFTTNKSWTSNKHEITITAEHLDRGIIPIASTLLHEMVHLSNWSKGIEDCSRNNTYHNKHFKDESERIGFIVDHDIKYGSSFTKPSDFLIHKINELKYIDVFKIKRLAENEGNPKGTKKPNNSIKYTCPKCKAIARATKKINLICGDCNITMIEN